MADYPEAARPLAELKPKHAFLVDIDSDGCAFDTEARLEAARNQAELARVYARYSALLAESGVIDFGDQVALALGLLRGSPAIRSTVAARYRYILVDEFQDTNRAQSEISSRCSAVGTGT